MNIVPYNARSTNTERKLYIGPYCTSKPRVSLWLNSLYPFLLEASVGIDRNRGKKKRSNSDPEAVGASYPDPEAGEASYTNPEAHEASYPDPEAIVSFSSGSC